ncbi:potassium channel subfamily K member 3-like [Oculina patagonica]
MERMLQELKNNMRMKYNMTDGDFSVVVEKATQAIAAGDEIDWTFFNSCGFTFAAITTIGYGNLTPTTRLGQGLTILFCLFGLPITMLALKTAGELIAAGIKRTIVTIETRLLKKEEPTHFKLKTVMLAVSSLVALLLFATVSTIYLEKWSFVEGLYAWFTAFTTIGFVDYIQFESISKKVDHGETSTATLIGYGILFILPYLGGLSLMSCILTCLVDSMDQIRDYNDRFIKLLMSWVSKPLRLMRKGSSYDVNE